MFLYGKSKMPIQLTFIRLALGLMLAVPIIGFSGNNPFKEDDSPFKPQFDDYYSTQKRKKIRKTFSKWGFFISPYTSLSYFTGDAFTLRNNITAGMRFYEIPETLRPGFLGAVSHVWRHQIQFQSFVYPDTNIAIQSFTVSLAELQINFYPFEVTPLFQKQNFYTGFVPFRGGRLQADTRSEADHGIMLLGHALFFGMENHIVKDMFIISIELNAGMVYSFNNPIIISQRKDNEGNTITGPSINLGLSKWQGTDQFYYAFDFAAKVGVTLYLF